MYSYIGNDLASSARCLNTFDLIDTEDCRRKSPRWTDLGGSDDRVVTRPAKGTIVLSHNHFKADMQSSESLESKRRWTWVSDDAAAHFRLP